MGAICICCVKQSESLNYPVGDITMMPMFPQLIVAFSKEPANKIEKSDCVIVNASKRHPENQFYFKHLDKKDVEQIKSLITKDIPGQVQVITNPLSSITVQDIIVMHLPVWGQPEAQHDFKKALSVAFQEAVKRNHKTIILTEFQQQRGIPTNTICKAIMNLLSEHQKQLTKSQRQYFARQLHSTAQPMKRATSLGSSLSK